MYDDTINMRRRNFSNRAKEGFLIFEPNRRREIWAPDAGVDVGGLQELSVRMCLLGAHFLCSPKDTRQDAWSKTQNLALISAC